MTVPADRIAHNWRQDGMCATVDPEVFFPAAGRNTAAKAICATCPVTAECLDLAMAAEKDFVRDERFGIYGGKSPNQRHKLEVARRQAEAADDIKAAAAAKLAKYQSDIEQARAAA